MVNPKKDKWLRAFCPEDACLVEEERFDLPETETDDASNRRSAWLEVFCPETSCEIEAPSQLP